MATQARELAEMPPYTAMLWGQFIGCPQLMYNLFDPTLRPGGRTYHSDKVMDMTAALHSEELCKIKVDSVEELHRITNDLLTMPILFHIKVQHERTDHYVVMKVRKRWKDEFAVLVNTKHPVIREMITHKLTEAMNMMQEGKKFCLKLDFGPSVRQWYSGVVDSQVSFCDSRSNSDSGHMKIYVHNCSTPGLSTEPCCIICCFPFWLLFGGPCFCAHRKLTVEDFSHSFSDLPVTMLTGVNYRLTVHTVPNNGLGQPGIPPPQGAIPAHGYGPPPNQQYVPPPQYNGNQPPPQYNGVPPPGAQYMGPPPPGAQYIGPPPPGAQNSGPPPAYPGRPVGK